MSKTLLVEVTAEDIENGVRHCIFGCPVALAVQRAASYPHIRVTISEITRHKGHCLESAAITPAEVGCFIRNFDAGDDVFPFKFEIQFT